MKLITTIIITTLVSILFTACGGGGGTFSNAEQKISVLDCNDTSVVTIPDDYTTMLSGDTIVEIDNNTTITTYHDVNDNKKICTVVGSAYLLRK